MERCFLLSFLALCLLPSVAKLFRLSHKLKLSSTSNSYTHTHTHTHTHKWQSITTQTQQYKPVIKNLLCTILGLLHWLPQYLLSICVNMWCACNQVNTAINVCVRVCECVYLIYISSQLHQQGDRLSHSNSVVDVTALKTSLQLREVTTGRAMDRGDE